jgi:hypothetical protein
MVGNLLEFSSIFLKGKPSKEEVEEQRVAMWRYRLFQGWFGREFIIQIQGQSPLSPGYLFSKLLIQFGAAICSYAKRWQKQLGAGMASKVTGAVIAHIRNDWQDLRPAFDKLLKKDSSECHWFDWRGPEFQVLSRGQLQKVNYDLPDDPIYKAILDLDSDDEMSIDDSDVEREDPSSSRPKRPRPEPGTSV